MTHEEIVARLKTEALDKADEGWISDLSHQVLEWDESNLAIAIGDSRRPWDTAGLGSIDIGHLARIVESILEEARS